MVDEQRARRIIEPIALILRTGMGEEGRIKSGWAQRALPRFHMQIQRAALLAMGGIRIALEADGPPQRRRRKRIVHSLRAGRCLI
jgi:hypothetical protein